MARVPESVTRTVRAVASVHVGVYVVARTAPGTPSVAVRAGVCG